MHMHTLDQLIARIAEHKGFTVQGTDAEALFARRGDDTLLAAWKTDGPITAADAQLFLTAYEQVHATSGILVAAAGADQAAKDAVAAARGVELWAESRLVVEVGEAFVRGATETHAPTAPVAPAGPAHFPSTPPNGGVPAPAAAGYPTSAFQASAQTQATNKTTSKFPSLISQAASASVVSNAGAAYYMPNKHKEAPADMQATIAQHKGGSLGYAWGGATGGSGATSNPGIAQVRSGRHPSRQVDQWGNLVPEGQQVNAGAAAQSMAAPAVHAAPQEEAYEIITTKKPKAAAPSAPVEPSGSGVLKINVSAQDALAKSGKQGTPKLALYPHVAFEYDLHMERPGLQIPVEAKGALLASSLSGELRTVDALHWEATAPADARRENEKLQAVDLYEKVKGYMLKTYSKTVSVEKEIAGNTVMENLRLVPDPEEMGLQHKGMILCPVWEITTSTGVTRVDAFTGVVS